MRKYLSLFIILALLVTAACGTDRDEVNAKAVSDEDTTTSTTTEPDETTTTTEADDDSDENGSDDSDDDDDASSQDDGDDSDDEGKASSNFPTPGNLDSMPKTVIEMAEPNTWFHRVFNERLFNEANDWGGADNWFVSLALGSNDGGNWTDHGNPGQIVYRAEETHIEWTLGMLTTEQYKDKFMDNADTMPAAVNVRITPDTPVTVVTASGESITKNTSDGGDITIILPDSGTITVSVDYTTAAPTHESLVWWGPYDRSDGINTIDAS